MIDEEDECIDYDDEDEDEGGEYGHEESCPCKH
jgi:hypothetical protein